MIQLHDQTNIPRSRARCPYCEATPAGCRGVRGLRGTYCCARCDQRDGNHDPTTTSTTTERQSR